MPVDLAALQSYLRRQFGAPLRVLAATPLGDDGGAKEFGYGAPILVKLADASVREVVVHLAKGAGFGHDTIADRGAMALLSFHTFNELPRHVRALDVGSIDEHGAMTSLAGARDFFVVTEYGEGEPYFKDLDALAAGRDLPQRDLRRVDRLAIYLATIHGHKKDDREAYVRRTRDLVGGHECIAGVLDGYDACSVEGIDDARLQSIERRCVAFRHRLKGRPERLCYVHGDFHPWNILFGEDDQLVLLDRSRGAYGEAADDVAALAINYLFYALRTRGRLEGAFATLWERFFEGYLSASHDQGLLEALPPYLAWRALVVASPLWYPHIDDGVRLALFGFIDRVLDRERFDPSLEAVTR